MSKKFRFIFSLLSKIDLVSCIIGYILGVGFLTGSVYIHFFQSVYFRYITKRSSSRICSVNTGRLPHGQQYDDGTSIVAPRRLRKVETVLMRRTDRLILVIEKSYDSTNQQAVLRTAEAFGIQEIWVIESAVKKEKSDFFGLQRVVRTSTQWLDMKYFDTTSQAIRALRKQRRKIWVTELSQVAQSLEYPESVLPFPRKVALVIGREADGASEEMLNAADKRLYLPIHGWADSFNLATSAALIIQKLFFYCPEMIGDMNPRKRHELRKKWYKKLAKTAKQKAVYNEWLQPGRKPPPPFFDMRRPDVHRIPWIMPKIVKRTKVAEALIKKKVANKDI